MKQTLFKKIRLRVAMLVAMLCGLLGGSSQAWGAEADETITFSIQGYTNQQAIETVSGTNFTIAFDKGTNSNAPKYYTSGTAIRAYGGNTFTVSSNTKTIEKIEITFGSSDGSNAITADVGTYESGTWTGSANSVKFTIGGTSGNRRLSAIAVTYSGGSTPPTPANPTISFGTHPNVTLEMWYFDSDVVDINEGDEVAENTEVFVKATPANGYALETLTAVDANGTAITLTENSGNYSFYMPNSNVTINATAVEDGSYEQPTSIEAVLNDTFFGTNYGGSASGINDAAPATGTKDNVTIVYAGSGNHYINDSQIRFYPSNKLTFTAPTGYKIINIIFTSAGDWKATISADKGTYNANTKTWTGSESTVIFTGSGSGRCDMSKATITLISDDVVAAPIISGAESFYANTQVTIAAEDGATIYYTTDDSTPTASSTQYTAAFTLNATSTVKAIAVKGEKTSPIAEKTFTAITPMSVAQALAASPTDGVYVLGIVSRVYSESVNSNGQIRYYISDDGTENGEMNVYNGLGLNGDKFTNISDIQVGDQVVIYGNLSLYSGANQLAAGNYLISHVKKAEPGINYATTEYTITPGATFETPTLINPNNLTVTYAISGDEGVATIDATTGIVTLGTEEGTVTITATFAGNANYRAGSASYTLTVADPTKGTISNPFTIAEVIAGKAQGKSEIYVIGYIVGSYDANAPKTGSDAVDTNLALADIQSETSGSLTIPVELPKNSGLRETWGCLTNGSVIGTQVLVKGSGLTYFSVNGIKNTTEVTDINHNEPVSVTISAAGYSTLYYGTKNLTVPTGMEAYTVKVTTKVERSKTYNAGDVIPAGEPVVLKAAEGTYQFAVATEAGAKDANNMLKGNDVKTLTTGGTYYYALTLNANKDIDSAGFYWMVANGAAYQAGAHKAYLALDKTFTELAEGTSTGVKGFLALPGNDADGIEAIDNATFDNAKVFNLAGQRVKHMNKGVYVVGGKKVLVK